MNNSDLTDALLEVKFDIDTAIQSIKNTDQDIPGWEFYNINDQIDMILYELNIVNKRLKRYTR